MKRTINGFEIIKDLGVAENRLRYGIVICKECKNKFRTSMYHLNVIKSCGCLPISLPRKLDKTINGFKILQDYGYKNGSRRALVICKVCKNEYEVDANKLIHRKHCGCLKNGSKVCKYTKSHRRLLQCYKGMMSRCYNKNNRDYHIYGKKGITVCKKWRGFPDNFCEWALKNGYKDNLTIDRISNKKNYNPENCRWVDSKTQSRNTSRVVLTMELANQIRKEREVMTYRELAKKFNVSISTIYLVISNKIWVP